MDTFRFISQGFVVEKDLFEQDELQKVQTEFLRVANLIDSKYRFVDIDECWNYHKTVDRQRAGTIYNAFKHLQSIKKLATGSRLESFLADVCKIQSPALIDINCRIDSYGEEKYLFGWHQDYWFSVCSSKAVVLWIPLTGVSPETGGLEIIGNDWTGGKIFKTKPNQGIYHSYADAVVIDEDVSPYPSIKIQNMNVGDVLAFSFNVLHKSLPVISDKRSRFTIQLRFADFEDVEFIENEYKPSVVNRTTVAYLERT